jgi:hypothetical protein
MSSTDPLTARLAREFSGVDAGIVQRQVRQAAQAVDMIGLDEEQQRMVELIARSELAMMTGARADAARLDPQRHPRRR